MLADRDAPGVEGEIDAAVAQGPDSEHREKAVAAVIGGEVGVIGERETQPGDDAPHGRPQVAIGGAKPAEEGRRSIGAADDGHGEREQERAKQRARDERVSADQRRDARRAQDEGRDEDEPHEQRAIDRAFDETGAPVDPRGVEPRRPAGEPIERHPGHQIDDRP